MSSQIKGGGRAVLSDECQESIISLLMDLDEENQQGDTTQSASSLSSKSKHRQQQEKRRFVKKLVERYERHRLNKQYNATNNSALADGNNRATTTSSDVAVNRASSQSTISNNTSAQQTQIATGNVRLEISDAVFKSEDVDGDCDKTKKKDKKKSSSRHHQSKSSSSKSSLPFQCSTKKVMVLPRSTSIADLCQQAKAKLRIKSKAPLTRAFIVQESATSSSSCILFDLQTDLSGISDGTTVYVTSTTTEMSNQANDRDNANLNNEPQDEIAEDQPEVDPLEQVKKAYAAMDAPRHTMKGQEATNGVPIVDSAMIAKWAANRAKLPVSACKSEILDVVHSHPVVVLSGATGSGKSTQIPQFLLEQSSLTAQQRPYIVVTQPRRVAAMSLAQRVAEEMGSPPPGAKGSSVGYIVRLDRRVAEGTCRIIYCTIGVLLRMLVCPKSAAPTGGNWPSCLPPLSLESMSHLILDEVHERDVNTDFSLTLLRGLLASKQYPDLRLILMSATASADFFVNYFASATTVPPASLEIPGRTFPVSIHWLSACECTAGMTLWDGGGGGGASGNTPNVNDNSNQMMLSPRAHQKIDNKLLRALITKIIEKQQIEGELKVAVDSANKYRETGAILVFLPGKAEIESLARCLYEDRERVTGDRNLCQILKLYSSMPRIEQQTVFRPALHGTVKIVLATNVAETSLTISDVSHVIDTGRVKESRFNASTRIKELVTVWTSQASANQRSGRAGRTSAGTCWRLYSEEFFENVLTPEAAPEMVRTPLDELILQICLLYEQRRDDHYAKTSTKESQSQPGPAFPLGVRPIQFLSKTPSPPPRESLLEGCKHLLEVDALRVVGGNDKEDSLLYRLTALGYHLSRLPMDAKVGKVLIVGCILGCLDGALTVAAALSCTKSCFFALATSNPGTPNIIKKRELLVENGFGGRSWTGGTVKGDLIAVIAVFRAWKKQKGENQRWNFCKTHGIDMNILKELDQLRVQYFDLLGDAGIVPKGALNSKSFDEQISPDDCNESSEDALLTSCCLIAGLYPNVCTLLRPRKGGQRGGRLLTKEGDVCRPHFSSFQRKRVQDASETGRDAYAVFHAKQTIVGTSTSSNSGSSSALQRPPEVFLTEVNFVSRFALLLFGGELEIAKNAIIVDGWLKFKVGNNSDDSSSTATSIENAVLLLSLREALDKVVLDHVLETNASAERKSDMMERHRAIIQVVRKLLAEEG